jgi:hypothetical protein
MNEPHQKDRIQSPHMNLMATFATIGNVKRVGVQCAA